MGEQHRGKNPFTGTLVMELPREEEAPTTQVMDPPHTQEAPVVPRSLVSPFPIAKPGTPVDRAKQIPWRETVNAAQPFGSAFDDSLTVELPPSKPEVVVVEKAPEPAPEELMPPSDPWGARLPKPAEEPARTPPRPPEKRVNPRVGMMKAMYRGKQKP